MLKLDLVYKLTHLLNLVRLGIQNFVLIHSRELGELMLKLVGHNYCVCYLQQKEIVGLSYLKWGVAENLDHCSITDDVHAISAGPAVCAGPAYMQGHIDFGVKLLILPLWLKRNFMPITPLCIKGEFYSKAVVLYDRNLHHSIWPKIPLWSALTTLTKVTHL